MILIAGKGTSIHLCGRRHRCYAYDEDDMTIHISMEKRSSQGTMKFQSGAKKIFQKHILTVIIKYTIPYDELRSDYGSATCRWHDDKIL